MSLPDWLCAAWSRAYIKRAGPDGQLGEADATVDVRYIQTAAEGHSFDLRIVKGFSLGGDDDDAASSGIDRLSLEQLRALASGAVECFAGVTKVEASEPLTVRWHAAFLYPPALGDHADPLEVFAAIAAGTHVTADVGVAHPTLPGARGRPIARWMEHAPDQSYEEEWLMLAGYSKQGAHVAAVRPAQSGVCGAAHLCINGNTFGFVRDIDRDAIPPQARNRPMAEVLEDAAIPLEAKRRLMDCEFSCGFFGQGGGVGGVVEHSSLPWCKHVALATLLGDLPLDLWQPIRPSDAKTLTAALAAIADDHAKACRALREAETAGQAGVAEVLRRRGAV